MIETSTLLVESTDSSVKDVLTTRLCLELEQTHKHILNAIHQSLPVPQSNAIALIPASSISSVSSSARGLVMPRAFAPIRARDQHQIFKKMSIVVIPRIFLAHSRLVHHWSEVSGTKPVISPAGFLWSSSLDCSRSFWKCSHHQFQIVRVRQHSMHIRIHPISLPNFPGMFFQSSSKATSILQLFIKAPVVSHMYSLDSDRISPWCTSSWVFMSPFNIVLLHVAVRRHMNIFGQWHQFLHVWIHTHKMSFQVLHEEWISA